MLVRLHLNSWPRDPPALASQSAGITGVSHHAWTFIYLFIYLFMKWSLSVPQAGVQWHDLGSLHLHLLGSSESPTSASWVAGTTGAHHHPQLIFVFLVETWWNSISTRKTKISCAWWCMPVVSAFYEAEAHESLELRKQRLQRAEIVPLHSSMGDRARLCIKRNKNIR